MADMRGEFKARRPGDSSAALFGGVIVAVALLAIGAWGYSTNWWNMPKPVQTAQINRAPAMPSAPGLAPQQGNPLAPPPANPAAPPPNGTVGPQAPAPQPATPPGNPG